MAAVSAPAGSSLLGKFAAARQKRAQGGTRKPSRLAAFVSDHIGTVAALAAADEGLWRVPWHLGPVAGPLGLCAAIIIAEFKVRG